MTEINAENVKSQNLVLEVTQNSEITDPSENPPIGKVIIKLYPDVAPKHVAQIKTLIKDGVTLLGDAAHPIVPFLGQGGCMALEDAYIFGKLLAKNINNIEVAQSNYQKIRLPRIKFIKQISENQGKLYHLSNPLLIKGRNFLMKLSNKYTDKRIQRIWDYDPDKVI